MCSDVNCERNKIYTVINYAKEVTAVTYTHSEMWKCWDQYNTVQYSTVQYSSIQQKLYCSRVCTVQ